MGKYTLWTCAAVVVSMAIATVGYPEEDILTNLAESSLTATNLQQPQIYIPVAPMEGETGRVKRHLFKWLKNRQQSSEETRPVIILNRYGLRDRDQSGGWGAPVHHNHGWNTPAPVRHGWAAPTTAAPVYHGWAAPTTRAPVHHGWAAPTTAAPVHHGWAAPTTAAPVQHGWPAPTTTTPPPVQHGWGSGPASNDDSGFSGAASDGYGVIQPRPAPAYNYGR